MLLLVVLAAACLDVVPSVEPNTSCAGDPTRPVTAAMLKRVLAGHDITVRAHHDGVICGGVVGSTDEEMPVELTNDRDAAAMECEGTVFCGLRRGRSGA